jgi:type IV secretion system protein VirB10
MPTSDEWRQLELEAQAQSRVARPPTAMGGFLKVLAPVGALVVAGYLVWTGMRSHQPGFLKPDNEEFRTTPFPAPSLSPPPVPRDQGRVVLEPPPPPAPRAPPEPVAPPPPPEPPRVMVQPQALPAPADDSEARRLAEEERRRWERFRAGSIVVDQSAEVALSPEAAVRTGDPNALREADPNRQFLERTAAATVETAQASRNRRIDALVPQGTLIRGVLETAVNSDLPGMVRAVVTEDVWSHDGRRILIPAGARLVGDYRSGIARGQTRVFIVWTRMLRADGVSVQLGSIGADDLGRAGQAGFVDTRWVERFGSAIVLSLVGAASQFIAGLGVRDTSGTGSTTTVTDPVTGLVTTTQTGGSQLTQADRARQIAAQTTSQTLTQIAQEALKDSISIPPTIHLDQGSRVIVFVRRDLDFSALYPDPVREALREIQAERRLERVQRQTGR